MAHCAVALIAILQLQSFPLQANISTPRSRRVSISSAQKYWRRAITSAPYLLRIYQDEVEDVLFVGVVEVSGVSHFYSASLWPVSLVLCRAEGKHMAQRLRRCLCMRPCPPEPQRFSTKVPN